MKQSIFLFYSLLFMTASCDYLNTDTVNTDTNFNPKAYFSNEAILLNDKKLKVIKEVSKNGISEQIVAEKINWKDELKPFIDIDVNKPAQVNAYIIDSIIKGEDLIINYTARDSSVNVKQMNIIFQEGKMVSFKAISNTSNLYYYSADTIEYFNDGNYRISTTSKPKLGKEITFKLSAKTESK